jgi:hypothetical protein
MMNGAVVAVAIGRGLRVVAGADWMAGVTVSVSRAMTIFCVAAVASEAVGTVPQ